MAHSTNIISEVKLPNGVTYQIHDAQAVHSASDLGLTTAMVFKGIKQEVADLPATGNKSGDVWHVVDTDSEYVWVSDSHKWEELGNVHDAASSTHTHTFSGSTSANLGLNAKTATVVTAATPTQKYLGIRQIQNAALGTSSATLVKSVSSSTATVVTGLSSTTISIPGYAIRTVMTGLGDASTVSALTGVKASTTSVNVVTTNGVAPTWSFTVANGLLTIAGGNGSAPVITPKTVATGVSANGTATVITKYAGATTTIHEVDEADPTNVTVVTGSNGTVSAVTSVTATTQKITYATTLTAQPSFEPQLGDVHDDGCVPVVSTIAVTTGQANITGSATGRIDVSGTTSEPVTAS